ncbi:hypothetical protein GRJ2_003243100 [Grus japonensis]|uniref:Integrase catalytic domain-containing protein n=1 Tax=Grus japonensis TaxID=30415 RepID=A0ABC9YE83_GRUJA
MSPEEEVMCAEEAPPYNKLPENEKPYALFTDGSCRIVGKHRRWKVAVWSPTQRVAEAAEGQGESSQFAEVKAIQLAVDIAERGKWPMLYLYTDSMDGGQCPVGVVTAVEAEQLAVQRQTHLGCPIVARHCCPAREASCKGKRYVLTMVEATTGWLETYPVPHATAQNTILGLEKQVLWRHGTPERIESDNGTHFQNNLIDTWAKEHGIEWVYHIPYHAPASGKIERVQELAIPKCQKSSKRTRRPARLSSILLELKRKRKVYGHWKQGQATREDYRDAVGHCSEKIPVCKAQLEFKLASTVKDNKKGVFKYVNSKRRIRDNIGLLLDEVGHLTNRDIDEAEMFNAFFTSVFNTNDGPRDLQSPVLEDRDWGDDKLPANSTCLRFAAPDGCT